MKQLIEAVQRLAEVASRAGAFDGDRKALAASVNLELASDDWKSVDDAVIDLRRAYRLLGAPGDWGYGTPEGDAVRGLYDAWNAALAGRADRAVEVAL